MTYRLYASEFHRQINSSAVVFFFFYDKLIQLNGIKEISMQLELRSVIRRNKPTKYYSFEKPFSLCVWPVRCEHDYFFQGEKFQLWPFQIENNFQEFMVKWSTIRLSIHRVVYKSKNENLNKCGASVECDFGHSYFDVRRYGSSSDS